MLHKEAWVAKLLGTHLSIQVHKKLKFSWRDNSTLALKGLIAEFFLTLLQFKNFKLRRVDIFNLTIFMVSWSGFTSAKTNTF